MAALGPLIGENLGVERAPIEVREDGLSHSVRIGDAVDFEIEDVVPFGVETGAAARGSPASSIRPAPSWTIAKATRRTSTPSGSSTRASPRSRRRASPGPPDVDGRRPLGRERRRGTGLAPAFARPRRLGLIALLFALAALAWWSTADRMAGMDDGPGTALGALGWFLGVWVVMMAAMMFPSVAPTVALYSRMTKQPVAARAAGLRRRLSADLDGRRPARLRDLRPRGAVARRHAGLGSRRALAGGRHAGRRGGLRADAAQRRLPGQVPQPAGLPARLLARRARRARCRWARGTARGAWAAAGR